MKRFSIRELENLSGIKTPTIRVWEHRYASFEPQRNKSNVRFYSVDDLAKILDYALLNSQGYKISSIARMTDSERYEHINKLTNEKARLLRSLHGILVAMYRMDTERFEEIFDDCFLASPTDLVVQQVIYPFLQRTSLLCQGKRKNEEHLVVTIIRRKLQWCIERTAITASSEKTALLFLFSDTQLDLMLLYFHYQLRKCGWKTIYMGTDISMQNLQEMTALKKPSYLFTYTSKKTNALIRPLGEMVKELAPEAKVVLVNSETKKPTAQPYSNVLELSCAEAVNVFAPKEKQALV